MSPTPPYATSDAVALFQRNLIDGASDFSSSTVLKDTTIDRFIGWVSNAVDMKFNEAGYVLPFQPLTGETWPTFQTGYLEMVTCLGVCSLISPALKPAPALGPGARGSAGNIFKDLYEEQLKQVYDGLKTHLRFRASYYRDTAAERVLLEPRGPTSDFLAGQINPQGVAFFTDFTDMMNRVRLLYAPDGNIIRWDWLFNFIGIGSGQV